MAILYIIQLVLKEWHLIFYHIILPSWTFHKRVPQKFQTHPIQSLFKKFYIKIKLCIILAKGETFSNKVLCLWNKKSNSRLRCRVLCKILYWKHGNLKSSVVTRGRVWICFLCKVKSRGILSKYFCKVGVTV